MLIGKRTSVAGPTTVRICQCHRTEEAASRIENSPEVLDSVSPQSAHLHFN